MAKQSFEVSDGYRHEIQAQWCELNSSISVTFTRVWDINQVEKDKGLWALSSNEKATGCVAKESEDKHFLYSVL